MNKSILLSLLFLLTLSFSEAQTVGYTHKILSSYGCEVKYSVSKQDTSYYIIVAIKSEKLRFMKQSTMLLKNFDGEVLKLQGELLDNDLESAGIILGGLLFPFSEVNSTSQFKITQEQFELIKGRIAKIRLTTIPKVHEKSFKKDKIGKKLYEFYIKAKNQIDDDF